MMKHSQSTNKIGISGLIPTTRVMSTYNKEHLGSPGPGMYDFSTVNEAVKSKTPSFAFGMAKRTNNFIKNTESPGPGNYSENLYSFGKNATQAGMKSKPKRNDDTISPGPGAYNYHEATIHKASA